MTGENQILYSTGWKYRHTIRPRWRSTTSLLGTRECLQEANEKQLNITTESSENYVNMSSYW